MACPSRLSLALLLVLTGPGCSRDAVLPLVRELPDAGGGPGAGGEAGDTADAGSDAGTDAGSDAGTDAGPRSDAGSGGPSPGADGGVVVPVDGGTRVEGTLAGRLTLAGSPYRVVGVPTQKAGTVVHVATVPAGQALVVEPGVVLDFVGDPDVTRADTAEEEVMHHQAGRVELRVEGRIHVAGTAAQPVALTSSNPWGWWGVNLLILAPTGTDRPVFEHMVFERVRKNRYNASLRDLERAAMWVHYAGGPVTISHAVFRDNEATEGCGALDLMYTDGSRIEDTLFEDNRTRSVDRFAQEGTRSRASGGAACITHGRNTVVRNSTFRRNRLEAWGGYTWSTLWRRAFLEWGTGQNDLGGGGALHYFQPDGDLVEGNTFEDNAVVLGPGAALYTEAVSAQAPLRLRNNRFLGNRAGSGGVLVCNDPADGSPDTVELVLEGNTFSGNDVPDVTGACTR